MCARQVKGLLAVERDSTVFEMNFRTQFHSAAPSSIFTFTIGKFSLPAASGSSWWGWQHFGCKSHHCGTYTLFKCHQLTLGNTEPSRDNYTFLNIPLVSSLQMAVQFKLLGN